MTASRESWALAALQALSKHGVDAVAVEPVARQLGVTKGSFYWHFKNRAQLLDAALELWEQRGTSDVIAALNEVESPTERLRQLFQRVSTAGKAAPAHAALASSSEPAVKRTLQRVATARLGFLARCYEDLGMTPANARRRALLAYATYLGTMQIARDAPAELASKAASEAYTAHVIEALVPGSTRRK